MEQISKQVYGVYGIGGYLNMYVIRHDDVLTVIDAGMGRSDIDRLQKSISAQGWKMAQIQHILITHCHFDHVGGLANLQSRCDANTYAHRLDAAIIRGEAPVIYAQREDLSGIDWLMSFMLANNAEPAHVDHDLNGDETLDNVLPGLTVVHLPGHTYGQCGYWLPDEGVLIGGDVAMRMPRLSRPFRAASPDWDAVHESLRKVADLNPTILCFGHGRPLQGDVSARIKSLLAS